MAGDDGHVRRTDYRAARIGAASALVAVVIVMVGGDILSPTYEASAVILTALLGTIITLLGIEAGTVIRGGK
jgi:hypothetical protein